METKTVELGLPHGMELQHRGSYLQIVHKWFGWKIVFSTAFAVVWGGLLYNWYSKFGSNSDPMAVLFPLLHVGVGIGITYYAVAGWFNRTYILVSHGTIAVKHGPFPWWGNKTLSASEIKQLYAKEKVTSDGESDTFDVHAVKVDPFVKPTVLSKYVSWDPLCIRLGCWFSVPCPTVNLVRCSVLQGLMPSLFVVEPDLRTESCFQLEHGGIVLQGHVFIRHGPPEALHEDSVKDPSPPVHTDRHVRRLHSTREGLGGTRGSLGCSDNLWLALRQGRVSGVQAERHIQRMGEPPGQHRPTVPVHESHQRDAPLPSRDRGNIRTPDLIRPVQRQPCQEGGIDPVPGLREPPARPRIERCTPHHAPQPWHALPVDSMPLGPEPGRHTPAPREGRARVRVVDQPPERQVRLLVRAWLVVPAGAVEPQQDTLSSEADRWVIPLNHGARHLHRGGQLFVSPTPAPS